MIKNRLAALAGFIAILSMIFSASANAVPMVGMGGVCPNAWALAEYISANYPVHSIGGVRPDPLPDHPSGHALDLMVDGDTALGNAIYSDLSANPSRFGIKYMLWQVPAHYNHVHVTVS